MKIFIPLSNGKRYMAYVEETTPVKLWRKPHDVEIVDYDAKNFTYLGDGKDFGPVRDTVLDNSKGMPEVYRVFPEHQTPLECKWVWYWRNLNPELTDQSFCSLMDTHLAWMNGTGSPPRKNCITGERPDAGLPAFDQARVQGGALLKPKKIEGKVFYIEGTLTSDPVPNAQYVIENCPWLWSWGTTVLPSGKVNFVVRQDKLGNMIPVRIPILSKLQLYVPIEYLDELPLDFSPKNYDPRTV
jgi:hypothetical protein